MESVNLKLTGRSGCQIDVLKDKFGYFVRKSSKNTAYNQRLILQAEKQKVFFNDIVFCTPKIRDIKSFAHPVSFDMDYVAGEKYSEFLVRLTKSEIDIFVDQLINFILGNIACSEIKQADDSIFIQKANSLKKDLAESDVMVGNYIEKLLKKTPKEPLPHGECHGDLTFSNMIFSGDKIYLIDFLDSFFNSPLIDIVKLRQDTCYYWTLCVVDEIESYKKNKMLQILRYIDEQLCNAFGKYPFYEPWYNYLQCFNLLRILPYIHKKQEKELVINALKTRAL